MKVIIYPSFISGEVMVPASKSVGQRACALALLHPGITRLKNFGDGADEKIALKIIQQLGAEIKFIKDEIVITGNPEFNFSGTLNCGESGLACRMFAMIAATSDKEIIISGEGSLLQRPMHSLKIILDALQVACKTTGGHLPFNIQGPVKLKNIIVDGSASSQYITGLLMAYGKMVSENISVTISNAVSKPYIGLTVQMMKHFGYNISSEENVYHLQPSEKKKEIVFNIESDWSSGAFWLVASAISGEAIIKGLDINSLQGDKRILNVLAVCGINMNVQEDYIKMYKPHFLYAFMYDATDTPDLFPPLVVLACYCNGLSIIRGVHRLINKESNRAETLVKIFASLGAEIYIKGDEMFIQGSPLKGGVADSCNDHRIAMAVTIAALKSEKEIVLTNAEAVNKSYPVFFEHLQSLGGKISIS